MKKKLTQNKLKELLNYDPESGVFSWKLTPTNSVKVGASAGSLSHGYIRIMVDGKHYHAHRLAFLWMEGYFPENDVDHINRIKDDNRWCNLREVSRSCNIRNTGNPSTNTSGVKGVSWNKRDNKWQTMISVKGKQHNLGYFESLDNAVFARYNKEKELNWNDCDSNSPAYKYLKNKGLI